MSINNQVNIKPMIDAQTSLINDKVNEAIAESTQNGALSQAIDAKIVGVLAEIASNETLLNAFKTSAENMLSNIESSVLSSFPMPVTTLVNDGILARAVPSSMVPLEMLNYQGSGYVKYIEYYRRHAVTLIIDGITQLSTIAYNSDARLYWGNNEMLSGFDTVYFKQSIQVIVTPDSAQNNKPVTVKGVLLS